MTRSFLLCVSALVLVAACGHDGPTEHQTPPPPPPPDLIAPVVRFVTPATDTAIRSDTLHLQVRVEDAGRIDSVYVVLSPQLDNEHLLLDTVPKQRGFVDVDLRTTIARDRHHIYVVAVDSAGNRGISQVAVTNDQTPPSFTLLTPQIVSSAGASILVSALDQVNSATGGDLAKVTYEVNSGATAVASTLSGSSGLFTVPVTGFRDGSNTLSVHVLDRAGNATTATGSVFRMGAPAQVVALRHGGCLLTEDHAAWCWGAENASGVLGNGTFTPSSEPRPVVGGLRFRTLEVNRSVCGITADAMMYCWGNLLPGLWPSDPPIPTAVPTLLAENVASGGPTATGWCVETLAGMAMCWGSNEFGQIGDGTTTSRANPTPVAQPLASVSGSMGTACGLTSQGEAFCWGYNWRGAVGDGTNVDRWLPTKVSGDLRFSTIATGSEHTCGLTLEGRAYCWGHPVSGLLGNGEITPYVLYPTPTPVSGEHIFLSMSVAPDHTCALQRSGEVDCWGINEQGQAGFGGLVAVPREALPGIRFLSVHATTERTCGISVDAAVYCWGNESFTYGSSFGQRSPARSGPGTGLGGERGPLPVRAHR